MKFDVKKTPNSRLLHSLATAWPLDLNAHVFELREFVRSHPQLKEASPFVYLYFFASPLDTGFAESESWVGLEVIGLVDMDEFNQEQELQMMDLDRSATYSFPLLQQETTPLLGDLPELYAKAQHILKGHGVSPASTWRIEMETRHGQDGQLSFNASLQFFAETEVEGP